MVTRNLQQKQDKGAADRAGGRSSAKLRLLPIATSVSRLRKCDSTCMRYEGSDLRDPHRLRSRGGALAGPLRNPAGTTYHCVENITDLGLTAVSLISQPQALPILYCEQCP